MFASRFGEIVKEYNRESIKMFAWYPASISSSFRLVGPPVVGGRDNPRAQIEAEAQATGRDFDEVAFEVI